MIIRRDTSGLEQERHKEQKQEAKFCTDSALTTWATQIASRVKILEVREYCLCDATDNHVTAQTRSS